ncbi:MAG: hypothetical protein D6737_07955 [Chloroflexi bacterium]|nr:MAG: hypothetical protein D6737_07955 [Chloroflexota bacterium]
MAAIQPRRKRKSVRGFVIAWVVITAMMGAITFAAIYTAYGVLQEDPIVDAPQQRSLAIPTATPEKDDAAAVAQAVTPVPTLRPSATPQPTADSQAIALAQAQQVDPTAVPTTLPVNDRTYAVGIQVQESFDNQDVWMSTVVDQLHMNWIKQQVRWEDIEPERGQFDWGLLDTVLPSAADHGLYVMLSIVTAPDWAREQGVDLSRHGPPENVQDYSNFVAQILQRYPGMVHAIEVWNEQNLDREWTSTRGLTAANYVELLRETFQTVKAIDPGIIVISGALSPTGFSDGIAAWDDFVYMDQLIAAGMLNYADCVGAHHNGINIGPSVTWDNVPNDPTATFRGPFDNPHHSWSFRSTLQTYANKVALAGGDQPLCVTEFGWASTEDMDGFPQGFEFANDNTLAEQRDWTIEALNNMEQWDIVWLAFLWNLNYGPQAGWDSSNDNVPYSIIGPDWNFRPVFDALGDWQLQYQERIGQ